MSPPDSDPERRRQFTALYEQCFEDVLRFVRRRLPSGSPEDVTHDAFLVAWRRFEDVPREPLEARAWVFGAARHLIRSTTRSQSKRDALAIEVEELRSAVARQTDDAAFRLDLVSSWRRLTAHQQEVLALDVWEQLPARLAGNVLGISSAAYRVRLHRARSALRHHLDATSPRNTSITRTKEKNA